jgi:hypothetical protein
VTNAPDLSGVAIVAAGAFNPVIFQPAWFAEKDLLPRDAVDDARDKEFVEVRQLSAFTADWLSVQVSMDQAVFSTAEEGREFDLRDLVRNVFDLLPETPIGAVGINADAHFRAASDEAWHAFGDLFLPKDFWQPLFEGEEWKRRDNGLSVGMRSMTVEAWRDDIPAFVRTEVAPSVRIIPDGVYVGINAHFNLAGSDEVGNGYRAARVIEDHWDETRMLEHNLIEHILALA